MRAESDPLLKEVVGFNLKEVCACGLPRDGGVVALTDSCRARVGARGQAAAALAAEYAEMGGVASALARPK